MASSSSAREEARPTRIMIGVNESSIRGYPHPSISSRTAFDWTLQKIVRSNAAGFKLLFLHVQIPDEDGTPKSKHPRTLTLFPLPPLSPSSPLSILPSLGVRPLFGFRVWRFWISCPSDLPPFCLDRILNPRGRRDN